MGACSKAEAGQGIFGFYMETFACKQSFPAAKWSRYTDSTCQTKDDTDVQEIVPLNFCRVGGWQSNNAGRKITCTKSGLQTTLWKNRDCTGSSEEKSDSIVGTKCMKSDYYGSHVKIESGCDGVSKSESTGAST